MPGNKIKEHGSGEEAKEEEEKGEERQDVTVMY